MVSLPAKIVLITSILLVLSVIASIIVIKSTAMVIVGTIIGLIFGCLGLALAIYDVDCTAMGYCNVWAWVKVFFIVISHILLITVLILNMIAASKKQKEPVTQTNTISNIVVNSGTTSTPITSTTTTNAITTEPVITQEAPPVLVGSIAA